MDPYGIAGFAKLYNKNTKWPDGSVPGGKLLFVVTKFLCPVHALFMPARLLSLLSDYTTYNCL